MTDNHHQNGTSADNSHSRPFSSGWAGGQISKGQIFCILRPDCTRYNTRAIQAFFTPERLQRCGLDTDEFQRKRLFSPDETATIISELETLNLL